LGLLFVLWWWQNDYDDDQRSRSPLKQRHNRIAFLLIIIKSITVISQNLTHDLWQAWINLGSFTLLFIMHFLSQAYWLEDANRAVSGIFLSLVTGAFCHMMEVQGEALPVWKGISLDWVAMVVGFSLGWYMELAFLDIARYNLNTYLSETFTSFDLADNPALIHRLGLAELLHSPTRQGGYADYLAQKYPKQTEEIEVSLSWWVVVVVVVVMVMVVVR